MMKAGVCASSYGRASGRRGTLHSVAQNIPVSFIALHCIHSSQSKIVGRIVFSCASSGSRLCLCLVSPRTFLSPTPFHNLRFPNFGCCRDSEMDKEANGWGS